jgi:hypothetical protein
VTGGPPAGPAPPCRHVRPVWRCYLCRKVRGVRPYLVTEAVPDGGGGQAPSAAPAAPCRHLAASEPFTLRECPTCQGKVRRKQWPCKLGLAVAGWAVPSLDCGARCPGYQPKE